MKHNNERNRFRESGCTLKTAIEKRKTEKKNRQPDSSL